MQGGPRLDSVPHPTDARIATLTGETNFEALSVSEGEESAEISPEIAEILELVEGLESGTIH